MKNLWFLILLFVLTGCPKSEPVAMDVPKDEKAASGITFEGESLKLAGIGIEMATESESGERLTVTGTLEADPAATAIVTSRVEGKIIRLTPNVGDTVRAGAVVAVIESEKLHEAQLNHTLTVKRLEAARADLARRRKLAGLGAYSHPGVEESRKAETEASAALEKARSEVRATESALIEARSRLASQDAAVEQSRTAEALTVSQLELVQKQVARSERLLAEQLVSRQEHEGVLGQHKEASARLEHTQAETRGALAKWREALAAIETVRTRQESAEKTVATARKQLGLARQALQRGEAIFKGGYLTSREVAEAEATVEQARVSAEGALDDVQLLGGQPGDNHSIPIAVPFAGRVLERKATLGQTVTAGEPILTLVNPRTLFAQLAVFPSDLPYTRPGQGVQLSIAGRKVAGIVDRLGESADEKTRVVKVRVRVDNVSGRLRPGQPVTATIGEATKRLVVVPAGAIQTQGGKKVVFVPTERPGEFAPREIEVGTTQNGKTEVRTGLKPGEKFVAKNAFLVKSQAMKSELSEE